MGIFVGQALENPYSSGQIRNMKYSEGKIVAAQFGIGDVVKHRIFPFRGVVFDIDPEFDNTDEWYEAIPAEVRPRKDQPYYHLLAENEDTEYAAYVSQQNLLNDETGEPVRHPQVSEYFDWNADSRSYNMRDNFGH